MLPRSVVLREKKALGARGRAAGFLSRRKIRREVNERVEDGDQGSSDGAESPKRSGGRDPKKSAPALERSFSMAWVSGVEWHH